MEQRVGKIAVIVVEDEAVIVQQEQDQEAGEKQRQAGRALPGRRLQRFQLPNLPFHQLPVPAVDPIQAEQGQQEQEQGAHGAEISIVRCHFAAPFPSSCRISCLCHCTPRRAPCQRVGPAPCQKRPSVVISLLLPLGAIYPHPGLENYPHCPHPYPPRPEISAFLAVDKAVERACERLPPVLWARDRCGSLPRIMRSGHIAGQRGPSCKLWGNLLLSHLFLFGEKKKVREKEKLIGIRGFRCGFPFCYGRGIVHLVQYQQQQTERNRI